MLDMVVCPFAMDVRWRMAIAGPGRTVRTVTVLLLLQGPYRDTSYRSGVSMSPHSRQSTDQREGID
jgi:hypothetical protein